MGNGKVQTFNGGRGAASHAMPMLIK